MEKFNLKEELKKNFFKAVNKEWLDNATIPSDVPSTGAFYELWLNNEKKLKKALKSLKNDLDMKKKLSNDLVAAGKYLKLASDYDFRDKLGTKPLQFLVDDLVKINDYDQYFNYIQSAILKGIHSPLQIEVEQSFVDSSKQVLWMDVASTILPNKGYYEEASKEKSKKLLAVYRTMMNALLKPYFEESKVRSKLITDALAYDKLIASLSLSSLEKAKYFELYHPLKLNKVISRLTNMPVEQLLKALVNKPVDEVVFTHPDNCKKFNHLYKESVFSKLKAWTIVRTVEKNSILLDNKTRIKATLFNRTLQGIKKASSKERDVIKLVGAVFADPISVYYGKKFFGETSKNKVKKMVLNMIKVYQNRLANNEWLSKSTSEKAISKLSKLGVHIGYPDEIRSYYNDIKIGSKEDGENLITATLKVNEARNKFNLSNYLEPVNKNYWSMSSFIVNAYFHPMMNHIVFPAGILDYPFYSKKQSLSANYGAIGAVIAHEISHAFDNNGANFDENGNLKMWWNKADFEQFELKTEAMVKLFDKRSIEFGQCDGRLTVSENIADCGGLICALEAAKKEKDFNTDDFFKAWATAWRKKSTKEYSQMLLKTDVHAPAELRANIQAANIKEFIDFYEINENDPMYISDKERVKIW
ncbi:M13 family metallopeptidase [Mycoplasmopsis opalescens]|uniref:M13 family metallopeptidase n=1 Tax=Mycoplasmopsis opalescens TaxID=114886 RepID=UPI0006918672|nr:M13 family metallopeptidase [Mycoplasmopsis opalescens]